MTRGTPRGARSPGPTAIVAFFIVMGVAAGAFLALSQPPSAAPASIPASDGQGSLVPPATGTPAPASSDSTSAASAAGSPAIAIDGSLLYVLPASILGAPLLENPDTEAQDVTDPTLAGEASALAVAFVTLPADSKTADPEFAVVNVVRLRPGVYSDAYFESWRETFDVGACSQADGVAQRSAQATFAGHSTFIGYCNGGNVLTYHVHLVLNDLIVSISSFGAHHLGQLIVEGLR